MIENKIKILNLFSALFCQPEKDLYKNPEIYDELLNNSGAISPQLESDCRELKSTIEGLDHEKLLVEYTKIFLGPFEAIAHPYSSVYFGEKTLMNDTTIWVLKFYNETGLQYDENLHDMPDNLIVELEFLYFLNHSQFIAIQEDDIEKYHYFNGREEVFFYEHFNLWIPKLCDKIIISDISKYYVALAKCLKAFVNDYKFYKIEE